MTAIKGLNFLPPVVTTQEALMLYKKVARINSKIGRLNAELKHSMVDEKMIELLSMNESVQSTRIEGTQVTFADMIEDEDKKKKRTEVVKVENYNKTLTRGVELIKSNNPLSTRLIQIIHTILMDGEARGTTSASGEFRKVQNFIGPDKKIENAVYIPVGAHKISEYMTNLEFYINGEHHRSFDDVTLNLDEVLLDENSDTLIKTAVLHAQFESIHPFLDGNGRVGRMLIVLSTMMDGLVDKPIFFVSEELEKERIRYYNYLNEIRGENAKWYNWINFFLDASERMTDNLLIKLRKISELASQGHSKIPDNHINTKMVWYSTLEKPFITVKRASKMSGIAPSTARNSLKELVELKLVDVDNSKKRNKVYINYDLLRILG